MKTFRTADGYTLTSTLVNGELVFTDGDMTFATDADGYPIEDGTEERLDGAFITEGN